MKQLSNEYRVETKWPSGGWSYGRENEGLTLDQAKAIVARNTKGFPDMRNRIVRTTETVIVETVAKRLSHNAKRFRSFCLGVSVP
jgi:hypothetical protein